MNKKDYPFLICPGAQKSGTTYLYNLLRQYDELCFADKKEVQFFNHNIKYEKGLDWYYDQFETGEKTRYLADFSQSYIVKGETIDRIKETIGDNAIFIIVLRDPVKRAFSNYRMLFSKGLEDRPFAKVVDSELASPGTGHNILGRGMYAGQLDYFFSKFPMEKVLMLEFNDFTSEPHKAIGKIVEFLGLDRKKKISFKVGRFKNRNTRIAGIGKKLSKLPWEKRKIIFSNRLLKALYSFLILISRKRVKNKPVLSGEVIEKLSEYYKESNRQLSEKYGINTEEWL